MINNGDCQHRALDTITRITPNMGNNCLLVSVVGLSLCASRGRSRRQSYASDQQGYYPPHSVR
jgi:hypothetical protein